MAQPSLRAADMAQEIVQEREGNDGCAATFK